MILKAKTASTAMTTAISAVTPARILPDEV
jgi:hypothetical protein